ncbi:hypothetical protein DYI37_14700 [Fulvimarina endophytica]|uniref:Methyl-accepting transducer domain-containing protein n=1 Tax=Fulvimarina endophytica TaxID=2293836 RepID=A0A371WZW4_9HYPH|nr:hypothetical protein [Fulvimarina endophytica]RFC62509.1 hypothetical protein DYI37_14700 [Fulvimarina endophytica]
MSALVDYRLDETDEPAAEAAPSEAAQERSLARLRERLESTTAEIETIFLGVGQRLIDAVGLLSDMRGAFASVSRAHEGPELAKAETAIRALVDEADKLIEGTRHERGLIEVLSSEAKAASMPLADLRRTVSMIGAIAMNARVIAAGIKSGNESELSVFTDDVVELARRAGKLVEQLREGRDALSVLLNDALVSGRGFEAGFVAVTSDLRARVERSLERASMERAECAAIDKEAGSASDARSREISGIVGRLQIGDNTRQRLEHIAAALALIDREPAMRGLLTTLETRQLADTHERLVEETEAIRDALGCLAADVEMSFSELSGRLGSRDGRAGVSAVGELARDIGEASDGLDRSEAAHEGVERLAGAILEKVESLDACSSELHVLEFEMRLVSLNTALTCSKLGEDGRALAVVSLQIRDLVSEMVGQLEEVKNALGRVGETASGLSESRETEAGRTVSGLVGEARSSLGVLQGVEGQLSEAGTALKDVGKRIGSLAREADRALDRQRGLVLTLSEIAEDLDTGMASFEASDTPVEALQTLDVLRRTYTMDDERRIHDGVVADIFPDAGSAAKGPQETGATASSGEGSADDLDDVLF